MDSAESTSCHSRVEIETEEQRDKRLQRRRERERERRASESEEMREDRLSKRCANLTQRPGTPVRHYSLRLAPTMIIICLVIGRLACRGILSDVFLLHHVCAV